MPIVFAGRSPSLIIVSIIKSNDLIVYFSLVNSSIWLLSWSIVTLVEGYLETPNLWYIKTVAEFFTSLAKALLTNKKIKEILFKNSNRM